MGISNNTTLTLYAGSMGDGGGGGGGERKPMHLLSFAISAKNGATTPPFCIKWPPLRVEGACKPFMSAASYFVLSQHFMED